MTIDKTELNRSNYSYLEREEFLLTAFKKLNSDLSLKVVVRNALNILIDYFQAQASTAILINLYDFKTYLHFRSSRSQDTISLQLNKKDPLTEWGFAFNTPHFENNIDPLSKTAIQLQNFISVKPINLMGLPLNVDGELLGVIHVINPASSQPFNDSELEIFKILGEQISYTLRNAWLLDEAIRGSSEARSLYEAGIALSSSLDLEEILEKILDNIRRVVQFDAASISLVDPVDGTIKQIHTRGIVNESIDNIKLKIGQGITGRVAQTGQAIIVSDVSSDPNYIANREKTLSEMAVPLVVDDKVIGVFNLESDKSDNYNEHHLKLMTAFASLSAISIERARLYRQQLSARNLEYELSIARRIQMSFLPSENPQISGFDISGINIPSAEVGGDYFDFIPIVDNQLGVALGDVSGKGIPAALIMASFRASLKAEIRNNFAIRAILSKVNNLMFESIDRDRYVTAIYGVLDSKNRIFTFSNAGHNPPIMLRANGHIEHLEEGGLALGMFQNSNYEERPISLSAGDIIAFYTDGVTEAQNESGQEFGEQGIISVIENSKTLPAKKIIENIISEAKKFSNLESYSDDLTIIIVKVL